MTKGNLYQYFLTEIPIVSVWKSPNEIFLCFTLTLWLLFFKYPRLKKPTFYLFFLRKTSFYAVCLIKKQNLSMLYAMLRNPSFTSALLIPMDLRMRFPARCVMAPIHVLFRNGSRLLSGSLVSPMRSTDVLCILFSADAPGICPPSDSPHSSLNDTGTRLSSAISRKRMKLNRSMIWYSISSSLRLYSDCRISILNIITTSNGLRPALLLRSWSYMTSRSLRNFSHGNKFFQARQHIAVLRQIIQTIVYVK